MVKSILVSHASPTDENSPYHQLAKEWALEFVFQNFVEVEGISASEFRKQKINPLDYTAIIFTSKYAIDHYFNICKDLRIEMPPDMKYFCISQTVANYLQKYIIIRKRKLYVGEKTQEELLTLVKKHSKELFLFPSGDNSASDITFENSSINVKNATVFLVKPTDLAEIAGKSFDMICFFSPSSIDALYANFPEFKQNQTYIAVYGSATAKTALDQGLRIDIHVPQPDTPYMHIAIENYLKSQKVED